MPFDLASTGRTAAACSGYPMQIASLNQFGDMTGYDAPCEGPPGH
jgi:hypothetical protein